MHKESAELDLVVALGGDAVPAVTGASMGPIWSSPMP